jgi:hypothetical protein
MSMRMLSLMVLCGVTLAVRADVNSGPAAGEQLAALKVYAATGEHKEKELDYRAERKDKPTVYVFVNQWDRPAARFLKVLDGEIRKDADDAAAVAVWLTDDADATKEYLPKAQQSLQLENTALALHAGKNGPDGWGLNDLAHLTVVVARGGKASASIAFVSVNETDVPKVREALRKAVKK